jgi:hypothetical protein
MPSLGVEELHPRIEVTHVRVGPVDERLDFRIDRPHDVTGDEIVDDHGAVFQECAHDLLDRSISLERLELSVSSW